MLPWLCLLGLLAGPDGASAAPEGPAATGASAASNPERDFPEYLAEREVVVQGVVVSLEERTVEPAATCGLADLNPRDARILRIAPEAILGGVTTTEEAELRCLRLDYPAGMLQVGARVIAWGSRSCHDDWRLWGSFVLVDARDVLHAPGGDRLWIKGADTAEVHLQPLKAALVQVQQERSNAAFDGVSGWALVRVRRVAAESAGGSALAIQAQGLEWLAGWSTKFPERFLFRQRGGCGLVAEGDTLLLPVRGVYPPEMDECASRFRVQKGFVPALGIPLSRAAEVATVRGGVVRLSPELHHASSQARPDDRK